MGSGLGDGEREFLVMLAGLLDVAAAEPILENEPRNARGLGGDVREAAGPDESSKSGW